jgi:hypothetical protein
MSKRGDDARPFTRLDGKISQISKHRFNFDAARRRESPGFGQSGFGLIDCRYLMTESCEVNGVAPFAFRETKHRADGNS